MRRLVIDYALAGTHPGYRFRPPTNGVDRATLDAVWRGAMPRGQGWGAEALAGARSLKAFPVDGRTMALSTVVVTDQQDELGRRGIRRAEIDLILAGEYPARLAERIGALSPAAVDAAGGRLGGYVWQRVLDRVLLRGRRQVVLAHPYRSPEDWQIVEALILRLVTSPGIRVFEGWGPLTPFTTLALGRGDEGRVVGMPQAAARAGRGGAVVRVD
jgi:hypothetical protein